MRLLTAVLLLAPGLALASPAGVRGAPASGAAPGAPGARRQSLLAGGRRDAAGASHLRPVITGCLKECGNQDQACTTQCQVCVEMNGCESVDAAGCGVCREEVLEARRFAETAGPGVLDSGGQPMLRDGVNMEFQHARLTSLDAKRRLRHARSGILQAQRQAEWAQDENSKEVERLHESKSILERKEEDLEEWRREHTQRLAAMREELRERRRELKRTKKKLVRAKERAYKVRKQLARFQTGKGLERWRHLAREAEDAYKRRHAQAKEQKRSMKRLRLKLRRREEDSEWLERGLKKEIEEAQELVDKDLRQVEATHSLWEHSRKELEDAKERYWKASDVSHQRDATAEGLKRRLDDFVTTTEPQMPNMTLPRV